MVKELSDKHLAAINRGRKDKGLKPIRRKKTKEKTTFTKFNNRIQALKKLREKYGTNIPKSEMKKFNKLHPRIKPTKKELASSKKAHDSI